ncbi:MAG TPA: aminotransferase class V-fold PLP-dependent enzyme [Pirellulales bacterium]|jgi:isopenicillin-N epimerase|nr:aminotransferase class V-fold PLP-dependent enzyme [Pirellulales bacterium]
MTAPLPIDDDAAWAPIAAHWRIRADTIYLNHGSYGPPPDVVRGARREWIDRLDEQPMDFFNRRLEPALLDARDRLARFVGASGENLIFVENATAGMNVVASSFRLQPGDEVLLNDHEYGAVLRIWNRACHEAGAVVKVAELPLPFSSADETVEAIFAAATERTRLLIVSQITSPTAVTLPLERICAEARRRGIAVAVDGPHAVAQLPLALDSLGCDFYAASCHKWLSAPLGSGFLYIAPRHQSQVRPPALSWGRIQPTPVETWSDEFVWTGTRDPSAFLTVPTAIDFLEEFGLANFRARTHWLAQYARRKLVDLTGLVPIVPDDPAWYGAMAHAPLPPRRTSAAADADARAAIGHPVASLLQHGIWREYGIEVPIVEFRGRRYVRVSCHLYNDASQIDRLITGLATLLSRGE